MLLAPLLAALLPRVLAHGADKCVHQLDPGSEFAAAPLLSGPSQVPFADVPSPPLEVLPLVVSGPISNRVDLVFFSDGYLLEERDKFLADAARLADDISGNQTFNTVKPLMNFWAAFTPSAEASMDCCCQVESIEMLTGILSYRAVWAWGVFRKSVTVYGLYRPGTELRGVYYAKPDVAAAACASLGEQCDYPILVGNDPLYGGLGGRFTVITPSLANGALVLRHELGHSIINVGEEYDGGWGYFGPNAAADESVVPWSHWLSASPRVERSVMPMQAYPWSLLNVSEPWSITFPSSGAYSRHLVRFSLSGLLAASDLRVTLDGQDLGWEPHPGVGVDRWHFDVYREGGLSGGLHTVSFELLNEDRVPDAQLCSTEVLEFGDDTEFNATAGHYSLYPTFSLDNATTYRPTNEDCLMRVVTTPNFCKACLEGLWISLLGTVSLIDSLKETSCDAKSATSTLELHLVPVAEFRASLVSGLDESYTITWSRDGDALPELANQTSVSVGPGVYSVDVQLFTNEVRSDPHGRLTARAEYTVLENCAGVI